MTDKKKRPLGFDPAPAKPDIKIIRPYEPRGERDEERDD